MTLQEQSQTTKVRTPLEAGSYPRAGVAHDGNQAVEEDHGHGEDEEEQQDYADDGVVAVVEEVQVCPAQHDGKQGYKGVQDIVELLQHRHSFRLSSGLALVH